jgi:hypothetical protein
MPVITQNCLYQPEGLPTRLLHLLVLARGAYTKIIILTIGSRPHNTASCDAASFLWSTGWRKLIASIKQWLWHTAQAGDHCIVLLQKPWALEEPLATCPQLRTRRALNRGCERLLPRSAT